MTEINQVTKFNHRRSRIFDVVRNLNKTIFKMHTNFNKQLELLNKLEANLDKFIKTFKDVFRPKLMRRKIDLF